ncbi:hypothetical protein V8C86DRAFT_1468426 [Haematococcus lacustris]
MSRIRECQHPTPKRRAALATRRDAQCSPSIASAVAAAGTRTASLVAVPRASSKTRIAATAPRPETVYLDLAQLLLQSDSATVGTLSEQAVHDTLSDVWLRAEERFILRVPKTTDTGHAAVLQHTMAQLTQLARNRGCELEWVEDVTVTLPSHPGSDPIPEPSTSSDPGPTPDPSRFGDGACPDEPPTLSSLKRLLQTTHLQCFHLHLPPVARAAGKGLPTARRAVDEGRKQASDPHSADLYAKPLEAEQVMQVLRLVQLQRGQEVQMS